MDNDLFTIIRRISRRLSEKGMRLSIAESCTGGYISNAVTNIAGSSQFYDMSIVCYSISAKSSVLELKKSALERFGTVSEETAVAMAKAMRRIARTDVSLSVTGVAGPDTVEGKDVGLVYLAVALKGRVESKCLRLKGDREEIKKKASLQALRFLDRVLGQWL